MRNARFLIAVSAVVCALGSAAYAQSHPLPEIMKTGFIKGQQYAEKFWLPVNGGDKVQGTVWFDNDTSNDVTILWRFEKAGAYMNTAEQTEPLSFTPTAACKRAGTDDIIYIIGWSQRTGRVIVEEWQFSAYGLGSAIQQGAPVAISLLTGPTLTRTVVFISAVGQMSPIWDAAYYPSAGALWLLDSASPKTIWSADLARSEATVVVTEAQHPVIADHRSMGVGVNGSGGLMIFTEYRTSWECAADYDPPYRILLFRDDGRDGVIDWQGEDEFATIVLVYGTWNSKYTAL